VESVSKVTGIRTAVLTLLAALRVRARKWRFPVERAEIEKRVRGDPRNVFCPSDGPKP